VDVGMIGNQTRNDCDHCCRKDQQEDGTGDNDQPTGKFFHLNPVLLKIFLLFPADRADRRSGLN